jgi:rhamnulokinase
MPGQHPSMVAIDLGAESCRLSLLHWNAGEPRIRLVRRFANAPAQDHASLRWNLDGILSEIETGLRDCAAIAPTGISSLGVDGWAVDYVRLDADGKPLAQPFCYRDPRTEAAFKEVERRISPLDLFQIAGAQPLRINTLYQLVADRLAGSSAQVRWVNLPEYLLSHLGGRIVSEHTNAAHTGLMDARSRAWSAEIFGRCALDLPSAPELVPTGTDLGPAGGPLAALPAFASARVIAPACHDTASAVAGIPSDGNDWAYISSGTWSLVGTLLDRPITTPESLAAGFTNFAAAGGRICFHKNVNGMWLVKECLRQLCSDPQSWPMPDLVAAAGQLPPPDRLLDLDDPALLLPGSMASRINAQRRTFGLSPIEEHSSAMPHFAILIFHSLAREYARVLDHVSALTGKKLRRIFIVGGGSLNAVLNRLTAQATGLAVEPGSAESSTLGNFAVQLATLEGQPNSAARIAHWARILRSSQHG